MEQIPILDVLRRHLSMIIILGVVAGLAGYGFSFLLTEHYVASALVLVRPQEAIKMDARKADKEFLDFPMGQSTSIETPSKTYIEIIKSPEMIANVVRRLGLDKEKETDSGVIPSFVRQTVDDLKQWLASSISILRYGKVVEEDPFARAVKGLEDNLALKAREDTYVFEIKYTGKKQQLAADVANTLAKSFIEFMDEVRLSENQYTRDRLQPQLKQSRQQLDDARDRLEDYKKQHAVFLHEDEYKAKLREISDVELELTKAEEALVASQSSPASVSLAAKRTRLVRLLQERRAELAPLPEIERELKQLEVEVQITLTAYQIIEKEYKESDFRNSYRMPEVRLVSQAVPPQLPSGPARGTIALASLLSGLVVGVGIAFFLEYLNRRVRGVEDVEEVVGIKVLATIPRVPSRRWQQAGLL